MLQIQLNEEQQEAVTHSGSPLLVAAGPGKGKTRMSEGGRSNKFYLCCYFLVIVGVPSIFVSHSKHDVEIRNFFTNITSRVGIKNYFMEWEDLENQYPGPRIADIIRSNVMENVKFVVVLLGPNLANPPDPRFTHNWVSFEVGVSAGCNKPVWVLEETNNPIDYPIPYVTDYYQYELDNVQDLQRLGELFTYYVQSGFTNKALTKCPHNNCNAKYNLWKRYGLNIHCPACRQIIHFQS